MRLHAETCDAPEGFAESRFPAQKKRRYLAQLSKMLKSARYLQKAMAGHIPVAVSPPEV